MDAVSAEYPGLHQMFRHWPAKMRQVRVWEEKKTKDGVEYFLIKARYLDFDGKILGKTSSEHAIEKFRGAKQITALDVFPLKYHPGEKHMRVQLSGYGRKFLSMMDVHLREYEGKAFYIEKGRVVQIFIKSRIVVDPAYFREENPNYTRPSIKESNGGTSTGWVVIDFDELDERQPSPAQGGGMDPSEVKGDDLLICSPTFPGFSLGNSRWVSIRYLSAVAATSPRLTPQCSGVGCRRHQRD